MKYAFNDFVFDGDQLLLYRGNEIVSCRHTEAKLLALFLSDPKRIFSKDDILEQVWVGKVVSEQAVFQNVSLLRVLLGDNAIKTFPKKGYQWQLEVQPFLEPLLQEISQEGSPEGLKELTHVKTVAIWKRPIFILFLLAIVLSGGATFYWYTSKSESGAFSVSVLPVLIEPQERQNKPINQQELESLWSSISHIKGFRPVVADNLKAHDDFFYSPQKYFASYTQQASTDAVMAAVLGAHNGKVSIRYNIKSKHGLWNAHHEADDIPSLLAKMKKHLALIRESRVLALGQLDITLMNAQLKMLHERAGDDLVILAALATSEIRSGKANNAILLADQLLEKSRVQGDTQAEGGAHLIAAHAYIGQLAYEEAKARLAKAVLVYEKSKSYVGLNAVQKAYGSLAFALQDYPPFKEYLNMAMQYAQRAQDPLMEVADSTYMAVIANKFGQQLDRQVYLDRAEEILDRTHQSPEHYGTIYFNAGVFAEPQPLAEKYYRKVLTVLPENQEWWVRERALAHLVDMLVKQSRWQDALDLFPGNRLLKASEELLITKIYVAQQLWLPAEIHALNAYKTASLNGENNVALDAALILLTIYQADNRSEKTHIYKQFIQKEALDFPYWVKVNQAALDMFSIKITH